MALWDELKPVPREHASIVWFMTFADLVCLLLAFFVLMFSMRDIDTNRFKGLSQGFKGAFAPEEVVMWQWGEGMKESEGEIKVQNKDVLGYLDNLLRARLEGDPVWGNLQGSASVDGSEQIYPLPAILLFDGDEMSAAGKEAAVRLAGVLRNWDNALVIRVIAPVDSGASLLPQAVAFQQALTERGVTVLRQAEWRLPEGADAAGRILLVVQGAK